MEKKTFVNLVKLLGEFVSKDDSEAPLTLTFRGAKFDSMDISRIRLLRLELPTDKEARKISGTYKVEYSDLKELIKENFEKIVLHRVHNGKMMFKITNGFEEKSKIRSIPAKRVAEDFPIKLQERRFRSKVEIDPAHLKRVAKVAEFLKSEEVVIRVDKIKQRVYFEIPEGDDEEHYRKGAFILSGKAGNIEARYGAAYLVDLLPVLDWWKCEVDFLPDKQRKGNVVLRVNLEDLEQHKIEYVVAPRYEVD